MIVLKIEYIAFYEGPLEDYFQYNEEITDSLLNNRTVI